VWETFTGLFTEVSTYTRLSCLLMSVSIMLLPECCQCASLLYSEQDEYLMPSIVLWADSIEILLQQKYCLRKWFVPWTAQIEATDIFPTMDFRVMHLHQLNKWARMLSLCNSSFRCWARVYPFWTIIANYFFKLAIRTD